MNDLGFFIQSQPLADTHEHQPTEAELLRNPPDVLQDIFTPHYLTADLIAAGAAPEAVKRLHDSSDPDIRGRFEGVRKAWESCRHTGYGEAAQFIAERFYGLPEITAASLEAARDKNLKFREPGMRLHTFRKMANVLYIHVDRGDWNCAPDPSCPEFYLHDLSARMFCTGQIDPQKIHQATNVAVEDLKSLRQAMEALFAKCAGRAIGVKSQHAYNRTLRWVERGDADAEKVLRKLLAGQEIAEGERLCLGDWGFERAVELSVEHNLPFKLHTGYCARNYEMAPEGIRPGNLAPMLMKHRGARFVFFHMSYPYGHELIAMAKHFPNVYGDMCWGWSIDPYSACDFVRRWIHAAPANKLFGFGGDTFCPNATAAYAAQARKYLTRALQAEVDDDLMTMQEAMRFAERVMHENQAECFDLEGTRKAIRETLAG
jgi:hypothetical protein